MKKKKKEIKKFESTEIKQSTFVNEDYKIIRAFFIVLAIVLALLGLLFYFNGKLVTKDMFSDETTTTTTASFDDTLVLADDIFKISDKEYMVLIYDSSDKNTNVLYDKLFNSYKGDTNLYGVDLANKMNKKHFDESLEKENTKPTKAEEIVVSGPRLLTIKKGEVTEYLKDAEKIKEQLASE